MVYRSTHKNVLRLLQYRKLGTFVGLEQTVQELFTLACFQVLGLEIMS